MKRAVVINTDGHRFLFTKETLKHIVHLFWESLMTITNNIDFVQLKCINKFALMKSSWFQSTSITIKVIRNKVSELEESFRKIKETWAHSDCVENEKHKQTSIIPSNGVIKLDNLQVEKINRSNAFKILCYSLFFDIQAIQHCDHIYRWN